MFKSLIWDEFGIIYICDFVHYNIPNIKEVRHMKRKIALVCALAMLVSIIPAFAASSDIPLRTQDQLHQQLKKQDSNCTTDQTRDKNKTESQVQKKLKIKDCDSTTVKQQDQTKTQQKKQLKTKVNAINQTKDTTKTKTQLKQQVKKQDKYYTTVKKQDKIKKQLKDGSCKAIK